MIEERFKAPFLSFVLFHDWIMMIGLLCAVLIWPMFLIEKFTDFRFVTSENEAPSLVFAVSFSIGGLVVALLRLPVAIGWHRNAYLVECRFVKHGLAGKGGGDVVVAFEFQGRKYQGKTMIPDARVELMQKHGTELVVIDAREPTRCSLAPIEVCWERFPERYDR